MRTRAFLPRAAICFVLALIPLPDLESTIWEGRMSWRGTPALLGQTPPPDQTTARVVKILATASLIILAASIILSNSTLVSAVAVPTMGVAIVVFLYQAVFHYFDWYIPTASSVIGILLSYLVFTGYRLALQENLQWRSLKQAQYLRELEQTKSNFLSLMSHDLKTPIAKIQAVVDLLRRQAILPEGERPDLSEIRDQLESIENANQDLKRHITSILNLSRIESQRVILNRKSNDINRVVQETQKRLRSIAQVKSINLVEDLEPLFSIEFDEDLIRQVLTNLLDNAIRYSPPLSSIIIRTREQDANVLVEIEDQGPGIPKDQIPLMFRKFSRIVHPLRNSDGVRGTGLGLYLSKYFIELHGGTIRVRSHEGQGTIFSFTLPLQNSETETLLS